MIEQYSVAQLIFTAVFFFLTAVILLLVSLRLAGYLGGGTEELNSPLDQLEDWLKENRVYCLRSQSGGVITIVIPSDLSNPELDFQFDFDQATGDLLEYGLSDPVFDE